LHCFTYTAGWELVGSAIVEQDDLDLADEWTPNTARFFSFNDDILISTVEMPVGAGASKSRVILRDITGKYVWDSQLTFIPPATDSIFFVLRIVCLICA